MLAENARRKLLKFQEINTAFSFPTRLFFTLERNLILADFDHLLGNHFRAVSVLSCNEQNYPISCNFRRAPSKHLITITPKIYPFFSQSLSNILSANGLPGLLPVGQVRRQSYLPKQKIYLSRTTGRGLFRALPST